MKKIIWRVLNLTNLGGLLQLNVKSYLKEVGWFRSFRTKMPVDKDGNPLAWYCYSFLDFLEPRLKSDFKVFEYGAGFSTLWYGKKVNLVHSVEGDKSWVDILKPKLLQNSSLVFHEVSSEDYVECSASFEEKYDIIVVDGRRRVDCIRNSVVNLTDRGVLILDNSDREEYLPGIELLKGLGYKQIQICGLGPITSHVTCSSVFYKEGNCLGL